MQNPHSGVFSGKTSEYIQSPRVSPIAHLNMNNKRCSEDTTAEEMVNAFVPKGNHIVEIEEQSVRILNRNESTNSKFEYPTFRERKLKEKKLRPLGQNTNHVLNFESSFDQPATGGNFFSNNANSAAFVTHSSDHRRPD